MINTCKVETSFFLVLIAYIPLYFMKFIGAGEDSSTLIFVYDVYKNFITPFFLVLSILKQNVIISIDKYAISSFLFFLLISIYSGELYLFNIALTLFALKNVNIDKFYNFLFYLSMILFCIIMVYFLINYFRGDAIYLLDDNYGVRYTFGYLHSNYFPMKFFVLVLLYILIKKKLSFADIIIVFLLSYLIYFFSHSRTAFVMTNLLVFLVKFDQMVKFSKSKLFIILNCFSILCFSLLSIYLASIFNSGNDFLLEANNLLSGRIKNSYIIYSEFDITALGTNISSYLKENGFSIDNLYVYLLYRIGFVSLLLLCLFYAKLASFLAKNGLYKESVCLFVISIYSFSEKGFVDIYNNILLFLFSFLIFNGKLNSCSKR